MTLEPNASVSPAGAVITPGWSDAAIFVAERTEESRRQLQSSSAVGLGIVFITFEWHRGPERTLSVSVSPDAQLHFAARIRSARDYGTRPFFGEIPHRIFELIQRVAA